MIYQYTVSTATIWTSFDYGEVEADSYEEAKEKAIIELEHYFSIANHALSSIGMRVEFDKSQVKLTLKNQK